MAAAPIDSSVHSHLLYKASRYQGVYPVSSFFSYSSPSSPFWLRGCVNKATSSHLLFIDGVGGPRLTVSLMASAEEWQYFCVAFSRSLSHVICCSSIAERMQREREQVRKDERWERMEREKVNRERVNRERGRGTPACVRPQERERWGPLTGFLVALASGY